MKPMKTLSYRPLNNALIQALTAYQARNYLPSLNAAINHALSMFLLENGVSNVESNSVQVNPELPEEIEEETPVTLDW